MRNKNLYFAKTVTQTFNNEANQVLALTTGGFGGTLPTGTDFISKGGLKVTITAHTVGTIADSQQFGSGYGTVVAGDVVDITKACTIDASNGQITMATKLSDPVDGFTINTTTTASNDNIVVTLLKPFTKDHAVMRPSNKLVSVATSGGGTTALNFVDNAGVLGNHDVITVTHGTGKQKEFMEDLMDVVADDNKVSGMIVVKDFIEGGSLPTGRGTAISAVAV